jgi:hypothetical protein
MRTVGITFRHVGEILSKIFFREKDDPYRVLSSSKHGE